MIVEPEESQVTAAEVPPPQGETSAEPSAGASAEQGPQARAADEASAGASAEPAAEPAAEASSGAAAESAADPVPPAAAAAPPEPPPPPELPAPPPAPPLPDHPKLRRHPVAPAMIAIDRIDDDPTFRIRPEGDLSLLATDIARLGQLFPVDIRLKPPDRFQVICGFRRVAALRFLQRDRVLARLHSDLSDEDALLMALAAAIHARPVEPEELEDVRARLETEGRLTPSLRAMLDKALSPGDALAPETVGGEEEEIDADELAQEVTLRLGEVNQDLSVLAEAFDSLDRARQDGLLEQLRYSADLVAYLESRR